jgi:hypothetical protein
MTTRSRSAASCSASGVDRAAVGEHVAGQEQHEAGAAVRVVPLQHRAQRQAGTPALTAVSHTTTTTKTHAATLRPAAPQQPPLVVLPLLAHGALRSPAPASSPSPAHVRGVHSTLHSTLTISSRFLLPRVAMRRSEACGVVRTHSLPGSASPRVCRSLLRAAFAQGSHPQIRSRVEWKFCSAGIAEPLYAKHGVWCGAHSPAPSVQTTRLTRPHSPQQAYVGMNDTVSRRLNFAGAASPAAAPRRTPGPPSSRSVGTPPLTSLTPVATTASPASGLTQASGGAVRYGLPAGKCGRQSRGSLRPLITQSQLVKQARGLLQSCFGARRKSGEAAAARYPTVSRATTTRTTGPTRPRLRPQWASQHVRGRQLRAD